MLALHVLVTALGVALGVLYPFISVILAGRGFSPGEIGLIASVGAVGFTVAVPAWGHLADVRFGRPRTLQLCALGAGLAVAALVLPWPPLVVVVLLMAFWVFESSWQPLADAITVNTLRGRDYARVRLFTSFGFSAATIASGFLYDRTGYEPAFVMFAIAAAVMVVATSFLPDVGRADLAAHRRRTAAAAGAVPAQTAAGPPPSEDASQPDLAAHQPAGAVPGPGGRGAWRFGSAGVALNVAPRLGAVLAASALLHIGIISGFTFLPLRIEALGGSPSDIALSAGLSAGSEIPAMLVMGLAARRFGLRAVFSMSALLYGACLASWTVIDVPSVIVATRAITGIAFAGVVVGVVLTIAALLPADLQATGQSLFQTSAFGVAAVVANVMGGLFYEAFGHAAVFGLDAALAVVAAVLGWSFFPRRGGSLMRQSGA